LDGLHNLWPAEINDEEISDEEINDEEINDSQERESWHKLTTSAINRKRLM